RAVAVLEGHARALRERAVVELERHLCLGQVLDRRPALACPRVVKNEVTLAERAALGVLTGQPDWDALGEQRRPGQRLGVRPVDDALLERFAAALDLRLQLPVHAEALGHAQQLLVERAERFRGNGGAWLGARAPVELVLA